MKTEQVVLEFLFKAAELIVQSRASFQSDADQRRGARRARVSDSLYEGEIADGREWWRGGTHVDMELLLWI